VHVEDHTSLVFLLDGGRRLALKRHGDEYAANGRRFSTAELIVRAASLSPNALLRPIAQDTILADSRLHRRVPRSSRIWRNRR